MSTQIVIQAPSFLPDLILATNKKTGEEKRYRLSSTPSGISLKALVKASDEIRKMIGKRKYGVIKDLETPTWSFQLIPF